MSIWNFKFNFESLCFNFKFCGHAQYCEFNLETAFSSWISYFKFIMSKVKMWNSIFVFKHKSSSLKIINFALDLQMFCFKSRENLNWKFHVSNKICGLNLKFHFWAQNFKFRLETLFQSEILRLRHEIF